MLMAFLALGFVTSCETYKVTDPEMTAVADFDGSWLCFGVNEDNDSTVFVVKITNTTSNEGDRMWMNISDLSKNLAYQFIDGIVFEVNCNVNDLTFNCDNSATTSPTRTWNPWYDQNYYTLQWYITRVDHSPVGKASIKDGKIYKEAIETRGNYKADAIEFTFIREDDGEEVETWHVTGMKNTGFYEDIKEYSDYVYEM